MVVNEKYLPFFSLKKTLVFYVIFLFFMNTREHKEAVSQSKSEAEFEYLIFGHFYGECIGKLCVEIFKLTENRLFEDSNDYYPGWQKQYNGKFYELENDRFNLAKDLIKYFPSKLLNEDKLVFGCPDCADGGGLYIELKANGAVRHWTIDQDKNHVPDYLHDFMDKVNEKIQLINDIVMN